MTRKKPYVNNPNNVAFKAWLDRKDLSNAAVEKALKKAVTAASVGNYREGVRKVPLEVIQACEEKFEDKILGSIKTGVDTNVSRETNVGLNVSARDIVESENYIGMHRRVYDTLEKNMDTHRILMMQMSETIKNLTGNQGGSPGGKQVSLPRE